MKTKVFAYKNIPSKLPVVSTAVLYLYMDKFNASPLAWGIIGTLWALFVIMSIISISQQEKVDLFDQKK